MKTMSKRYAIFLTALFCAFLGVFMAANAIAPDRASSEQEKDEKIDELVQMLGKLLK